MEDYKNNIIKMINDITDINLLEYLEEYIKLMIETVE